MGKAIGRTTGVAALLLAGLATFQGTALTLALYRNRAEHLFVLALLLLVGGVQGWLHSRSAHLIFLAGGLYLAVIAVALIIPLIHANVHVEYRWAWARLYRPWIVVSSVLAAASYYSRRRARPM